VRLRVNSKLAEIDVADSGPGIRESDARRIFERLYRSGTAVAQQVPGAGLGLTIALAIAEAHHGSLGLVRSNEDGTTFRMELPLAT
jgi:protein-histidine pros-kinase